MTYIAAADLRLKTMKPFAAGLLLTEADADKDYLDLIIAQVTTQVELDLNDDFEPAGGDPDETMEVSGNGLYTMFAPRRIRAITTLKTRDAFGTLTTQAATTYRLRPSLNTTSPAGTVMVEGRKLDELTALSLSTSCWPDGSNTVQIVGKFGWAAVPEDIKRLVALRVYELVKAKADPLTTIVQRTTTDAIITYGPSTEEAGILKRYRRDAVLVS